MAEYLDMAAVESGDENNSDHEASSDDDIGSTTSLIDDSEIFDEERPPIVVLHQKIRGLERLIESYPSSDDSDGEGSIITKKPKIAAAFGEETDNEGAAFGEETDNEGNFSQFVNDETSQNSIQTVGFPKATTPGVSRMQQQYSGTDFWTIFPSIVKLADRPDIFFLPPEVEGLTFKVAHKFLLNNFPFPLLSFISSSFTPLEEEVFLSSRGINVEDKREDFTYAKFQVSRMKKVKACIFQFKDLHAFLEDIDNTRMSVGAIFQTFDYVRVKIGFYNDIIILCVAYDEILCYKPKNGRLWIVSDVNAAIETFTTTSIIEHGSYDPELLEYKPDFPYVRAEFERAGILSSRDFQKALYLKAYFPKIYEINSMLCKRVSKPVQTIIKDAIDVCVNKSEGAPPVSLPSRLYIQSQIEDLEDKLYQKIRHTSTKQEFKHCDMAAIDKHLYDWLFTMLGFCPVYFMEILCSVLVGRNNRQCIIVIFGDVHCGKSLLLAILNRVLNTSKFQNLDDLNTLLAYADGCDAVVIDDVTEYDMKILNNNRGLISREKIQSRRKYGHYMEVLPPPFIVATNMVNEMVLHTTNVDSQINDPFRYLKSRGFFIRCQNQYNGKPPFPLNEMAACFSRWLLEVLTNVSDDGIRMHSFLTNVQKPYETLNRIYKSSKTRVFNYLGSPQLEWPEKKYYGAFTWALAMSNEITAEYQLKRIGLRDGDILKLRNYVLQKDIKVVFGMKAANTFANAPMPEAFTNFSTTDDNPILRHLVLGDEVACLDNNYERSEITELDDAEKEGEDDDPQRPKSSFEFKLGLQHLLNQLRATENNSAKRELMKTYFKRYKGEMLPFKYLFHCIAMMASFTVPEVFEVYKTS